MMFLLPALLVTQAAFLLRSAVDLTDVVLQQQKGIPLLRFLLFLALPLAVGWFGRDWDSYRLLCGWTDCLALTVSVGLVRLWSLNQQAEELRREQERAALAEAEAAEAERKAYEEASIRAATASLEARQAREAKGKTTAPFGPRSSPPFRAGPGPAPAAGGAKPSR